jgi:hypothetical protein
MWTSFSSNGTKLAAARYRSHRTRIVMQRKTAWSDYRDNAKALRMIAVSHHAWPEIAPC